MATFGRIDVLEEAIYCFIHQDYTGDKELIVVNDHPGIKLYFEHSEVRVINCDTRFPSMGAKRNYMEDLSNNDMVQIWGDDDIHLPWTLSTQVAKMMSTEWGRQHKMFCPIGFVKYDNRLANGVKISWIIKPIIGLECLPNGLAKSLGYYSETLESAREEFDMAIKLLDAGMYRYTDLKPHEFYLIWRLGVCDYHLTMNNCDYNNCMDLVDESVLGEHELIPHWNENYVELFGTILKQKLDNENYILVNNDTGKSEKQTSEAVKTDAIQAMPDDPGDAQG